VEAFSDAMQIVGNYDPATAQAIAEGLGNGSLEVMDIDNEVGGTFLYGRGDGDTLAVDVDGGLNAAELATVIIHEWVHVMGFNTDPNYGDNPEPCNEAEGYAEQLDAMDAISCETTGGDQPSCAEWRRVAHAYHISAGGCELEGGTPAAPSADSNAPTPSCGCSH
jgi:hypothetical protein